MLRQHRWNLVSSNTEAKKIEN
uniref:Uncharacterized protein n=1 Tax=Arundo donax TaxID=35708 RepID=A0A0A9FGW2_ARUDO